MKIVVMGWIYISLLNFLFLKRWLSINKLWSLNLSSHYEKTSWRNNPGGSGLRNILNMGNSSSQPCKVRNSVVSTTIVSYVQMWLVGSCLAAHWDTWKKPDWLTLENFLEKENSTWSGFKPTTLATYLSPFSSLPWRDFRTKLHWSSLFLSGFCLRRYNLNIFFF